MKLRTTALPYAKNTIETAVSTHSAGHKLNVKSANMSCLFFSPFPSPSHSKIALLKPARGPGEHCKLEAPPAESRVDSHFAALYARKTHLVAAFLVLWSALE